MPGLPMKVEYVAFGLWKTPEVSEAIFLSVVYALRVNLGSHPHTLHN